MTIEILLGVICLFSLGVNAWLFITRAELESHIKVLEKLLTKKAEPITKQDIHDVIKEEFLDAEPFT